MLDKSWKFSWDSFKPSSLSAPWGQHCHSQNLKQKKINIKKSIYLATFCHLLLGSSPCFLSALLLACRYQTLNTDLERSKKYILRFILHYSSKKYILCFILHYSYLFASVQFKMVSKCTPNQSLPSFMTKEGNRSFTPCSWWMGLSEWLI